jgi:hypothetical protein
MNVEVKLLYKKVVSGCFKIERVDLKMFRVYDTVVLINTVGVGFMYDHFPIYFPKDSGIVKT